MDLKERTINHYNKMIEWAKTQDPLGVPTLKYMKQAIGEHWYGNHCPVCSFHKGVCSECIIHYYEGVDDCTGTPWIDMDNASTWKEWLEHAQDELLFLKSLNWEEFYKPEGIFESLRKAANREEEG